MPHVATKEPYTLFLREDDDPPNPRADYDNFGTMVCFHRRYTLGDKHDYDDPADFLRGLVRETIPPNKVVGCVFDERAKGLRFHFDEAEKDWSLQSFDAYAKEWDPVASFGPRLYVDVSMVADAVIEEMQSHDLIARAKTENVILPLNLYDHSGLSMSTGSFVGRAQHAEWDSGQVGWIYATKDAVLAKYGGDALTPEVMEKAAALLKAEVETYDSYLRGACYGFELYEGDAMVDSCWGFIGDPRDLKDGIESCLPDECRGIMDDLEYRYENLDIEDVLAEREETTGERPSVLGRLKEMAAGVMPPVPSGEKTAHSHDAR